jgi:RimJ/RimL family protein N-acetyltransferase
MSAIIGRHIILRPIEEGDLNDLFRWRNDPIFLGFCSTRRNQVNFETFKKELGRDFQRDRDEQYMVLKGGSPIGTIYSYGTNLTDGYTFVTIFIDGEQVGLGYGVEAFALFVHNVFNRHQFFKIYTEVYSYNHQSISAMEGAGFIREGCFCQHRLFGGQRYDLLRYAFYYSQMPQWQKFLSRITGG